MAFMQSSFKNSINNFKYNLIYPEIHLEECKNTE